MKKINSWLCFMAIFSLLISSCSEDRTIPVEQENGTLSLNALLQDLGNSQLKQAIAEIPECTDDEVVYVELILSQNGTNVVGSEGNPFRVNLAAGQLFTQEVPELELAPGDYTLDYFVVFSADDEVIWVAPMEGSELAGFVDDPLPLAISLGAGVKKYVDVPVLCFDNRMVNEYGYLFFELVPSQAIEWCIFGNYCDDTGRHFPAQFSVNVWNYANGQIGSVLYSNIENTVTLNEDGDYAGSTVCIALPDTEGTDEYYVEITLLNSDAYGEITETVIREGVLTDDDVRDLFSGEDETDYYHFREGCDNEDVPNLFDDDGGEPSNIYFGTSGEMGDGTVRTMARLNDAGDLLALGIQFSEEALEGLTEEAEHLTLQFPEEAGDIIYDHFDVDWVPHGHEPPGVYDLPHFDFHFYMISEEEKMQITNPVLAEILPDEEFWPATYFPGPGYVPMMGKHWLSSEAGEFTGEGFTHTFIYGSYNGDFIFYEPMITLAYLQEKTSGSFDIPQPANFERSGSYPTTYSINYDPVEGMYTLLLEDFVER